MNDARKVQITCMSMHAPHLRIIQPNHSAWLFFRFALRASTQLHDKALGAVLAAPLSFFHSKCVDDR